MADGAVARKVHILVVEDNPSDVELLRMALQGAGVDSELTVLEDGAEALALLREQGKYAAFPTPDLAILDLNLPKMDGLDVLSALRSSPRFGQLPVAVLSSSASPRDRAKLEGFRVGRYITKPPDLEEFLRIGEILKEFLASGK